MEHELLWRMGVFLTLFALFAGLEALAPRRSRSLSRSRRWPTNLAITLLNTVALRGLAVLALDAARDAAAARVVRHQHHVAPGQADEGGERRALVAALFLLDLDQQLLAFLDDLVDARLAGRDTRGKVLPGDFLERQEAVAVFAVVDETGFQTGLDARDHGLVDVALALFAPFDFDFVVEELLSVDDGQAAFFGLRGVDEHPLHDAIPLRVLRRAAAQPTGLRGLPPAVPNQKQALPEL
mgnify:CR=1 FL=1